MEKTTGINTMTDQKSNTDTSSKNWLQRLKDESWEAELLVSTISIFGAFQMFGVIDWLTNKFIDKLFPDQYLIGYFIVFFGLVAVSILVSMFVIHFFLRAYWVGLVGLNSVFPDYSVEDSVYSKIYTERLLSILPKLKNSIQKVDELCSVIFSVAFTFLLTYAYMAISAGIYLLLFNMLSEYIPAGILLIPVFIMVFGLLLQMLVGIIANLKAFKDKRELQIFYFKIVHIVSMLSFGPLYKSIVQVFMIFGTNFRKKKHIVYLLILFLFSGAFVAVFYMFKTNIPYLINHDSYFDKTRSHAYFYKTENKNTKFLLNPEVDSDIIETNAVKLFIPIFSHEEKMRNSICDIDKISLKSVNQKTKRRQQLLDCYQKYNLVFINGKEQKVDFLRYYHPVTRQFGVVCYLDLSHVPRGLNTLEIKKDFGNQILSEWVIPFYYIAKNNRFNVNLNTDLDKKNYDK